ncbi:MAG: YebC/PmpR family DNA-binding transcriptional regulator, partial [Clostridia bacterium]|nr:YebC/PmpR family DNA-binding transcriptional regulator [Clostridia bacterium]
MRSGHSKWSNIKHKKEKSDAQRAKVFTKIGKEIAIAIKAGGPDPTSNSKLRDLIAKAKSNNVPNDNIDRIIKKASGETDVDYEELYYEGYGPSGVAVIVYTTTDNRNRTASEMRHYFDKFGGNLGQSGCVSYMFEDKGHIIIVDEDQKIDEDQLMEDALEAGAEDLQGEDGIYDIYTDVNDLSAVREALEAKGYAMESAEKDKIPST